MEPIVFKRWSNKKYAVMNTLHKVIRIGTLSLVYNLLTCLPLIAQTDTAAPVMFYDLEAVETVGEQEADLELSLMRQLTVINNFSENRSVQSLAGILDHQPGIDIRTRGVLGIQSDINIQGGSFDQSLVLLNGIPISNPHTGHFSLDLPVHPSASRQLEILKGSATKKYGAGAYAGAVNLVTQPADSLEVRTNTSFGQYQTYNLNSAIHLPSKNTKTLLTASLTGSDGYTYNTDLHKKNLYLHSVTRKKQWHSDIMLGWNKSVFGANAFYSPKYPDQYEETGTRFAALKFTKTKNTTRFFTHLAWKRHLDHYLLIRHNPAVYENHHRSDAANIAAGTRISTTRGVTTARLQIRHESILSSTLGDPLPVPINIGKNDSAFYTHAKNRNLLSLSAGHHMQLNRLHINAGLLLHTHITNPAQTSIYPGIDLGYMLKEKLSLFGSVNRSMRLPTFTELYYEGPLNRGSPHLLPEKAVTAEGGFKYNTHGVQAGAALFYRKGKQVIDWMWSDSTWVTANLDGLDTYGGECSLILSADRWPQAPGLFSQLHITYSYIAIDKPNDSYISNYALDNLKHKFTAGLNLSLPYNVYLENKVMWQDRNGSYLHYETPASSPVEKAYDPFWLLDVQAGIRLNQLTVFMNISNALNTTYRDIGSVVMPGRWITAGISFR